MGLTKPQKLIKEFKTKYPFVQDEFGDYPESGKMELDNLDYARLKYNDSGEVVVENEHGNEFPVNDLSNAEIELFRDALNFDFC